jgi:signal transduction histidine kinase
MLATGAAGPLDDVPRSYAETAFQSTGTVLRLLDEIADISQVEAGLADMTQETVNLAGLVEDSLRPMAERAADQNITLRRIGLIGPEAKVTGDGKRLLQAMNSLLSAALDASMPGETVEVGATERGDGVEISVTDMGGGRRAGLPAEDGVASINERGANFRLTMARTIIERHGGSVQLEGVSDHGLKVRCHLPARNAA